MKPVVCGSVSTNILACSLVMTALLNVWMTIVQPKYWKMYAHNSLKIQVSTYSLHHSLVLSILNSYLGSNEEAEFCCNSSSISNLQSNLAIIEKAVGHCPSCYFNIRNLYCNLACDRHRGKFFSINPDYNQHPTQVTAKQAPNNNQIVPKTIADIYNVTTLIKKMDFYVEKEFTERLFDSCAEVLNPTTQQQAINIWCSNENCNPTRWLCFFLSKSEKNHLSNSKFYSYLFFTYFTFCIYLSRFFAGLMKEFGPKAKHEFRLVIDHHITNKGESQGRIQPFNAKTAACYEVANVSICLFLLIVPWSQGFLCTHFIQFNSIKWLKGIFKLHFSNCVALFMALVALVFIPFRLPSNISIFIRRIQGERVHVLIVEEAVWNSNHGLHSKNTGPFGAWMVSPLLWSSYSAQFRWFSSHFPYGTGHRINVKLFSLVTYLLPIIC